MRTIRSSMIGLAIAIAHYLLLTAPLGIVAASGAVTALTGVTICMFIALGGKIADKTDEADTDLSWGSTTRPLYLPHSMTTHDDAFGHHRTHPGMIEHNFPMIFTGAAADFSRASGALTTL